MECALAQNLVAFQMKTTCFGAEQRWFEWINEVESWRGERPIIYYKIERNSPGSTLESYRIILPGYPLITALADALLGLRNPDVGQSCLMSFRKRRNPTLLGGVLRTAGEPDDYLLSHG
jgi:hypothetical protein